MRSVSTAAIMSSSRAEHLLEAALTYRSVTPSTEPVKRQFESSEEAVKQWTQVLLHEAHEAMMTPLSDPPSTPYLHPVDMETDEPGIVETRQQNEEQGTPLRILRKAPPFRRITYEPRAEPINHNITPPPDAVWSHPDPAKAAEEARAEMAKTLKKAEKKAATAEKRAERQKALKEARAAETAEERDARLAVDRAKREERKRRKAEEEAQAIGIGTAPAAKPPKPAPMPPSEDALLAPDVSVADLLVPVPARKRAKGDKASFFEHPLPHHRHLQGLTLCAPHADLLPALLRGEACDALEILQGPPGTGKTRALVDRIARFPKDMRIFLCAPTNVGATNLYARCLAQGLGDECALALAPERIPPGTVVLSNDVRRRIVCATISARSGPALEAQSFQAVFVDEAGQCMEAWVWTLLRREVAHLILAGDTRQLPATTSESGRALRHERSLMERLEDLEYENVTPLLTQNRMCPLLLSYPNDKFYKGCLRTGVHAPTEGSLEWVVLKDGAEEQQGTSLANRAEAAATAAILRDRCAPDEEVVLLAPYTAHCRLLLALGSGREIHTCDSFQGRESETIVLNLVRDGTQGFGFWSDPRRLTVALTRARRRLIVVASRPETWAEGTPLADWYQETGK